MSTASARPSSALRIAARFGFAAKGFVYVLIGVLAFMQAVGLGGRTASPAEALTLVRGGTFGTILLWALAAGLAGYVVWCAFSVFADPEGHGTDAGGLARRAADGVRALVYGGLAFTAWQLASSGQGGGGGGSQSMTDRLMQQPAGPWLVGGVGALLAIYALYQFKKVLTAEFMDDMRLEGAMSGRGDLARKIGRLGLSARAIVFLMTAGFLIWAAIDADARRARGLEGSLITLSQQPYGPWLLGIVALGLVAYGLFQGFKARYKIIRTGAAARRSRISATPPRAATDLGH